MAFLPALALAALSFSPAARAASRNVERIILDRTDTLAGWNLKGWPPEDIVRFSAPTFLANDQANLSYCRRIARHVFHSLIPVESAHDHFDSFENFVENDHAQLQAVADLRRSVGSLYQEAPQVRCVALAPNTQRHDRRNSVVVYRTSVELLVSADGRQRAYEGLISTMFGHSLRIETASSVRKALSPRAYANVAFLLKAGIGCVVLSPLLPL